MAIAHWWAEEIKAGFQDQGLGSEAKTLGEEKVETILGGKL